MLEKLECIDEIIKDVGCSGYAEIQAFRHSGKLGTLEDLHQTGQKTDKPDKPDKVPFMQNMM